MKLKELKKFINDAIEYYGEDARVKLFNKHGEELNFPIELSWENTIDDPQRLEFS